MRRARRRFPCDGDVPLARAFWLPLRSRRSNAGFVAALAAAAFMCGCDAADTARNESERTLHALHAEVGIEFDQVVGVVPGLMRTADVRAARPDISAAAAPLGNDNPAAFWSRGGLTSIFLSRWLGTPVASVPIRVTDTRNFVFSLPLCIEALDFDGYLHVLVVSEEKLRAADRNWREMGFADLLPFALAGVCLNRQNSVQLPFNRFLVFGPGLQASTLYLREAPEFLVGEPYLLTAGLYGGRLIGELAACTRAAVAYQPLLDAPLPSPSGQLESFTAGRYRLLVLGRPNAHKTVDRQTDGAVLARIGPVRVSGGEVLPLDGDARLYELRRMLAGGAEVPPAPEDISPLGAWDAAALAAARYREGKECAWDAIDDALRAWPDCLPLLAAKVDHLVRAGDRDAIARLRSALAGSASSLPFVVRLVDACSADLPEAPVPRQ